MALVSQCKCENPRIIHNRYSGEDVYTSCGKCISCRRSKQAVWVSRIQQEAKCHLYCYELELDYNERSLPKFDFSKEGDSLVEVTKRLRPYYRKFPEQKIIYLNQLNFDSDADRNYFIERLNTHHTCIPHASVYDVQLFKKRLNTLIKREVTGKYQNFRSVICSELGGTTIRPHMHGILFFDEPELLAPAFYPDGRRIILRKKDGTLFEASKLDYLVFRSWRGKDNRSLGHAYVAPDRGQFASYLAKYVCLPSDIPSFYSHPALRPFFLTSRKPAIGSLFESSEEIRFLFDNATPKRVEFQKQGELWVLEVVPIGQSFENRLFPKCYGYSKMSNVERGELYRCAIIGNDVPSYNKFVCHIFGRVLEHVNRKDAVFDFNPWQHYVKGFYKGEFTLKNTSFARLIFSLSRQFESERMFQNLYTVSKRVFMQSKILGVHPEKFINKCLLYHNYNKPQFLLQQFYQLQNKVLIRYPDYDYKYFYPLTYMSEKPPQTAPDAMVYFKHQKFKYNEEKKTKDKNAYFESLQYKDHPLYVLLNNYYNAKKCNEDVKAVS